MSRKAINNILSLGLNNSNQMVRAMSLTGLSSVLMHPKKVRGDATATPGTFPGGGAFETSLHDRWDRKGWMGKSVLGQES